MHDSSGDGKLMLRLEIPSLRMEVYVSVTGPAHPAKRSFIGFLRFKVGTLCTLIWARSWALTSWSRRRVEIWDLAGLLRCGTGLREPLVRGLLVGRVAPSVGGGGAVVRCSKWTDRSGASCRTRVILRLGRGVILRLGGVTLFRGNGTRWTSAAGSGKLTRGRRTGTSTFRFHFLRHSHFLSFGQSIPEVVDDLVL